MVHGDFEWMFIADLNRTIACARALCGLLLSTCPRSASHNFVNTHQNENRFLAFGSLTSSAEVENAMISVCIIICSKFSGL